MKEIIERLAEANGRYGRTGEFSGDASAKRRAENAAGQKPYATVVTCSDSRVVPEAIFSAGIGELFVVRTAGNVIGDHELASIEYAVEHLHTGVVIVMGHTCCGAVGAAMHGEFGGAVGVITKRIKSAIGAETDPYKACVRNVMSGVETVAKAFGDKAEAVGAVYDILSGKVEFLNSEKKGSDAE